MRWLLTLYLLVIFKPFAFSQNPSHKLDSLVNAYSSAKSDTVRYRVMVGLCTELETTGSYQSGLDTAYALIKYARNSHNSEYIARGFNSAAVIQNRMSLYDAGLKSCDSAIYFASKIKNQKVLSSGYVNSALIYSNIGKIDSSLFFNFKALAIDSTTDDKKKLCGTLNNIGYNYMLKADYPKANEYFFKSLKVAEESNNERVMGNCLINIGAVYTEMEKYDLAEEYFQKCYEIRKRTNNRQGLAAVLVNFSEIYRTQGKYALALSKGHESLTYSVPIGYFPNVADAYSIMSGCYLQTGETDSAVFYAQKAVDISREKNIKNTLPGNLVALGDALLKKKSFEEAGKKFEEALSIAVEMGRKNDIKSIYDKLSIASEEQGNIKEALDYYKKYKTANDSLLSEDNQETVAKLEVEYNTEKKEKEIIQLNYEKKQRENVLQKKQLALTRSELENKNKQEKLEKSETARKLSEAELKQAEYENHIFELKKNEELARNKTELERKSLLNYILGGGIGALVLITAFAVAFFIQRQKLARHKNEMEKQKAIENTRSSIASDLHDDIGATLSSINIYSKLAKEKLNGDTHVKNLIEKINNTSQEMMNNMSDMVWAIKPDHDSPESLSLKIKSVAREMLSPKEINYKIESNETGSDKISMEARRNIFLIAKEAINNIAKYSEAKNVLIKIIKQNGQLHLEIADDGIGFSPLSFGEASGGEGRGGVGIGNMKQRTEQLHGKFALESGNGNGTKIKSVFDLDKINY